MPPMTPPGSGGGAANPPTDYAQQLFSYLQAWRQYLEQAIGTAPGAVPPSTGHPGAGPQPADSRQARSPMAQARSRRPRRERDRVFLRPRDPIGTITDLKSLSGLESLRGRPEVTGPTVSDSGSGSGGSAFAAKIASAGPPHRLHHHQVRRGRSSPVAVRAHPGPRLLEPVKTPVARRRRSDPDGGRPDEEYGRGSQTNRSRRTSRGFGRQTWAAESNSRSVLPRAAFTIGRDVLPVTAVAGVAELAGSVARQVNQRCLAVRRRANLEAAQLPRADQVLGTMPSSAPIRCHSGS